MRYTIHLLVFLIIIHNGKAQENIQANYPQIGKPCPEFLLKNIYHYSGKEASLKDFKGKWLVLDFFTLGCVACFESFPKINKLQNDYADKIQILIVGKEDASIRQVYENFRKHYGIELAVAFDTVLFKQFGIRTVPHVIYIDEQGIVRGIYGSLTNQILSSLINSKDPGITIQRNEFEKASTYTYNFSQPLLTDGNGGKDTDFLFRSVLMKWNQKPQRRVWTPIGRNNMTDLIGVDLKSLYWLAYGDTLLHFPVSHQLNCYGKSVYRPILETRDSSLFVPNYETAENLYSYSLIVPDSNVSQRRLQSILKNDLENYFGYSVSIEHRKLPYWRLVANKNAKDKLITKGGSYKFELPFDGATLKNAPISDLIWMLWSYHQNGPPFIDETGIKNNIDLKISAVQTDIKDVMSALERNGLSLVPGEKKMKVIIIRDPTRPRDSFFFSSSKAR